MRARRLASVSARMGLAWMKRYARRHWRLRTCRAMVRVALRVALVGKKEAWEMECAEEEKASLVVMESTMTVSSSTVDGGGTARGAGGARVSGGGEGVVAWF